MNILKTDTQRESKSQTDKKDIRIYGWMDERGYGQIVQYRDEETYRVVLTKSTVSGFEEHKETTC